MASKFLTEFREFAVKGNVVVSTIPIKATRRAHRTSALPDPVLTLSEQESAG